MLAGAGTNTRLCHLGHDPFAYHGFVNPPVVHASTVLFPDVETMESRRQKYTYGTRGTPTTDALCAAIDALEGSAGTIIVPSGLAAITVPFLAFLSSGDHALIVDSVYSPCRNFCDTMLKRLGVTVEYYDPAIGAGIETLIKPNTRLVHTEAPGSNTFEMQDIRAIADVAHRHGCVVTMDNTWATPLYFKPLDFGVDISMHAATKYPSGHSDILMGTVSANAAHWEKLSEANITLGICGAPMTATRSCVGCAPWALGSMRIRMQRLLWRSGSMAGKAWRVSCIRPCRVFRPRHLEARFQGCERHILLCTGRRCAVEIQAEGAGVPQCALRFRAGLFLGRL